MIGMRHQDSNVAFVDVSYLNAHKYETLRREFCRLRELTGQLSLQNDFLAPLIPVHLADDSSSVQSRVEAPIAGNARCLRQVTPFLPIDELRLADQRTAECHVIGQLLGKDLRCDVG